MSYPSTVRRLEWNVRTPSARSRLFCGAMALGITVLAQSPAQAQQAGAMGADVPSAPVVKGSRRVHASVGVSATYDSNVARGSSAVAAARGLPKSDWIYEPNATVSANLPIGRQTLFAVGNVGYQFHDKAKSLDGQDIGLLGGADLRGGPCGFLTQAGYRRNRTDLQYLPIAGNLRNTTENRTASGTLSCYVGNIRGQVLASADRVHNTASGFGVSDSRTHTYGGNIGYGTRPLGTLALSATQTTTDYDPAAGFPLNARPGYKSTSIGLLYERQVGLRLSGRASISAIKLDPDDPAAPTYKTTGAMVGLNYKLNPRTALDLSWDRSTQPSNFGDASFALVNNVALNGTYAPTDRLTVVGGVSRREIDRKRATPLFRQVTNERLTAVEAQASYRLGRLITLSLRGAHEDQVTDLPEFNYKANRITIGVSAGF